MWGHWYEEKMTSQNKQIIKINHEAMTLTTTKCNLIQQFNEILTQDLPSIRRSLRATDKLLLLVALPSSLQHFTAKIKRHLLPRSVNYMSTQSAGGPGNRDSLHFFIYAGHSWWNWKNVFFYALTSTEWSLFQKDMWSFMCFLKWLWQNSFLKLSKNVVHKCKFSNN